MQSDVAGVSAGLEPLSSGTNSNDVDMDDNNVSDLSQGVEVVVRMEKKPMLFHIMEYLGAKRAPVFSELDRGSDGVQVSIKLYVADLSTLNGDRISYTVLEGQPALEAAIAETSAVMKAFNYLQQNHLIKIVDFSSRVAQRYEASNLYALVVDGMASLEKIFTALELNYGHCKNFAVDLGGKQFDKNVGGPLSPQGKIYTLLANKMTSVLNTIDGQMNLVQSEMADLEVDRIQYTKRMALKAQKVSALAQRKEVGMDSKDVLEYVMHYFHLAEAEYSNSPLW